MAVLHNGKWQLSFYDTLLNAAHHLCIKIDLKDIETNNNDMAGMFCDSHILKITEN